MQPLTRDIVLAAIGWPAQRSCCICGHTDEPIEMHHVIRRSDGGERGPQLPLCKTCHGHAKGDNYTLYPSCDKWYVYITSDDFARYLAARTGRPRFVERYYPLHREQDGIDLYVDPEEQPDPFEEVARIASENLRVLRATGASSWRQEAENIASVYAVESGDRFCEWREGEGIGKADASRMLSVAAFLEADELRERPMMLQVEAARAIRRERGERSDIITDASVLSVTDFRAKWWPPKGAPEKERCPKCGLLVDPKRLNPEEE